jgi:serine/threonine protein kinase
MTDETRPDPDADNPLGTLVIDHLEGVAFDQTITRSAHELRSPAEDAAARVHSLPRIVVGGTADEGDFSPIEAIGEGGVGVVELVHQRSVNRDVALKRVRDVTSPSAAASLLEEGHVMGLLEHPGVVPVFALGRDDSDQPVLVMKRIEGSNWRSLLRDPSHRAWERLTSDRLEFNLRVLCRVADVAHFAHARQWLHRDIKPENVMIGEQDEVYLIDWGLAVRMPIETADVDQADLVGTPAYMAPEMLKGVGPWLSPRTDVYLMGAVLHEVLTGSLRHGGETLRAVLSSAWLSEPVDYPPETPAELAALANEATAARASDRVPDAEAFRRRIELYLQHREAEKALAEGRGLFEQLVADAGPGASLDEVSVIQRFDACAAVMRRGLEIWPESPDAKRALSDLLVWRIRHSLAQGDVLTAQATLLDLPAPDPAVESEVATESLRISLERLALTRLSDLGRRHDPHAVAPLRARAARESGLIGGAAILALGALIHAGVMPFHWWVLATATALAAGVAGAAALHGLSRGTLVDRRGLRSLAWIVAVALALMPAAYFVGLAPGQLLALLPIVVGACVGMLEDIPRRARIALTVLCAATALAAPLVLRWSPAGLFDLLGLVTIAAHLVLARMWDTLGRE